MAHYWSFFPAFCRRFRNLLVYGMIGGLCASLDFGVYTLLCHSGMMPYLWANVLSTHCGIFCSFSLNRSFNFRVTDKVTKRFLSFYAVGLIGLAISELLLYLMVAVGGWNELACKILTVVVVSLLQFILNKYITFKRNE